MRSKSPQPFHQHPVNAAKSSNSPSSAPFSILTGRFRPESDVDALVEFQPGRIAGFLGLAMPRLRFV